MQKPAAELAAAKPISKEKQEVSRTLYLSESLCRVACAMHASSAPPQQHAPCMLLRTRHSGILTRCEGGWQAATAACAECDGGKDDAYFCRCCRRLRAWARRTIWMSWTASGTRCSPSWTTASSCWWGGQCPSLERMARHMGTVQPTSAPACACIAVMQDNMGTEFIKAGSLELACGARLLPLQLRGNFSAQKAWFQVLEWYPHRFTQESSTAPRDW